MADFLDKEAAESESEGEAGSSSEDDNVPLKRPRLEPEQSLEENTEQVAEGDEVAGDGEVAGDAGEVPGDGEVTGDTGEVPGDGGEVAEGNGERPQEAQEEHEAGEISSSDDEDTDEEDEEEGFFSTSYTLRFSPLLSYLISFSFLTIPLICTVGCRTSLGSSLGIFSDNLVSFRMFSPAGDFDTTKASM